MEEINGVYKNEIYEHDSLSLSQWKALARDFYKDEFTLIIFPSSGVVDKGDPNTYHKILCEGVGSFGIQMAYWDNSSGTPLLRWFPSIDPEGDGDHDKSHFEVMKPIFESLYNAIGISNEYTGEMFGAMFNIPEPGQPGNVAQQIGLWLNPRLMEYRAAKNLNDALLPAGPTQDGLPQALKFTFRIYDSKGIIKDGRTFTYIVYLGN